MGGRRAPNEREGRVELTMELTREIRAKRIAVARDVLAQLDRKDVPLKVRRGTYLAGPMIEGRIAGPSLQPYVDKLQEYCEACAIGAAFLSYVRLFGVDCDVVRNFDRVWVGDDLMRDHLATIFDGRTLDLIESMFEGENMIALSSMQPSKPHIKECDEAGELGGQFFSAAGAIQAICQILIENDGDFVIPA